MTVYRLVVALLTSRLHYRQIELLTACSDRATARARRVLDAALLTVEGRLGAFSSESVKRLFADGPRAVEG